MAIVVCKIGGSLFDLPDLAERLQAVLALRRGANALIVSGGGDAAELVRRWDAGGRLGDDAAHRLAIRAMDFNARMLAEVLPAGVVVGSVPESAAAWDRGDLPILAAGRFLFDGPAPADPPPASWDVTSDSIAAFVARNWRADELLLLKSCQPTPSAVDAFFPQAAADLAAVGWVNLRDEPLRIQPWSNEQ